jgi:hypothetical protein
VPAADLGQEDWVDLRLSMNRSFVPKARAVNSTDDRELGLMVHHLYVGEADKLGDVPNVVAAQPVTVAPATASTAIRPASPAPARITPAKSSPNAAASPAAPRS